MRITLEKNEPPKNHRSLESYSLKEKWASLSGRQRVRFVWDYFKLPIFLVLLLLYFIGWLTYREITHKDTILYAGLINFAPAEEVLTALSDDFLLEIGANPKKEACKLYTGWYITTDKESGYYDYNYASQMKILASIDDEQLDVVFMNREAFDAFSQNGYLMNLEELIADSDLSEKLSPYLVSNIEFINDNAKDLNFDETVAFEATTAEAPMGLDLSESFLCKGTEYSDTLYLGVIANSPRSDGVIQYLSYLWS